MSYAFHTPDKLSFILDLMNGECVARPQRDLGAGRGGSGQRAECPVGLLPSGGDLHYHLSQHGVFSEADMRFYAAEIILGLEHMHNRFVVYRDLKVRCPRPVPSLSAPGPPGPRQPCPRTGLAGSRCGLPPTLPFSGTRL